VHQKLVKWPHFSMVRAWIGGVVLLAALAGCATAGVGSASSGAATTAPAATEDAGAPPTEAPPQPPGGGGGGGGGDTPGYVTITAPQGLGDDGVVYGQDGSDCVTVRYLSGVPIPDGVTLTPTDATLADNSPSDVSAMEYFAVGGSGCQNPVCAGGTFTWTTDSAGTNCGIPVTQRKGFPDNQDASALLTLHTKVTCRAGQAVCDAYKSQLGNVDPLSVGLTSKLPASSESATATATPTN
jgi:hypothetical protein